MKLKPRSKPTDMKIDTKHLEDNILGTLIMWPECYELISDALRPFMFSDAVRPLADYIFHAISEGLPVDVGIVIADVQQQGLSTPAHILAITEAPNMDEIRNHAARLREAYLIKQDAARYSDAHKAILEGKPYHEIRARFDAELEALDSMVEIKHDRRFEAIHEAYNHLIKGLDNDGLSGVTTGFPELDENTGGWQPGNLMIFGARPGMGKTTIALDWVYAAAEARTPVMFVSLEMSQTEVLYKLAAKRCAIPPYRLQRAEVNIKDTGKVWKALEYISELPLFIFDDTNIQRDINGIRDTARRMMRTDGLGLIVIDYLQLMDDVPGQGRKNREERIGDISRGLKRMAGQLGIPIIALSQLSRAVEIRGGSKEPMLSDLRDSGSLEQDGNLVGFIYRPEYYGIKEDADGNDVIGKVKVSIAKHRMGQIGEFWFDYDAARDSYRNTEKPETNSTTLELSIPAASRPGPDGDIPF